MFGLENIFSDWSVVHWLQNGFGMQTSYHFLKILIARQFFSILLSMVLGGFSSKQMFNLNHMFNTYTYIINI